MSTQDRHVRTYLEEARELLGELEEAVLELEEDMSNAELINRIFRAMHTIKGSGAMFGFDEVAAFTHHVESALDRVRNGEIAVTKELIGLVLAARDEISSMLFPETKVDGGNTESREHIIARFRALVPGEPEERAKEPGPPPVVSAVNVESTYRIRFVPGRDALRFGMDPLAVLSELESMGSLWVTAVTESVPGLEEVNSEECYLGWDMTLVTTAGLNAVRDVFIFFEGGCELVIDELAHEDIAAQRLGDILVKRGDVRPEDLEKAVSTQKRLGEILALSGVVPREKIESALVEQRVARQQVEKQGGTSIRVASEKLEQLINIVGELVTTQAQLTQAAASSGDAELLNTVERVELLTNELRDCVLGVRMLPIGSTFGKYKRLVRDLSADLGKEVEFTSEGDETELDKTVIEKISNPLVHLIRNSLDHGIETPEEREAAGKPRRGHIRLSAAHAGGEVVLCVEDDGKGLDTEVIGRKAMEKGLVGEAKNLNESELLNLIFQPGFSTAKKVTDVSGRGVGMDVVRREIESLRGSVDLASRPGKGTTVTIRLPLTLAIIDGLLVESGQERYVIPLHHVKECVELTKRDIEKSHQRHVMDYRGNIVPYIRLNEFFGIRDRSEVPIEQVIVVEVEDTATGLVADRIIGEKQAVIKPLGRVLKDAEGVSGATILGDGTVALILDVPQLTRSAEREAAIVH